MAGGPQFHQASLAHSAANRREQSSLFVFTRPPQRKYNLTNKTKSAPWSRLSLMGPFGQGSTSTSPYLPDLQTTIHLYNLPCFNARHACRKRANTSVVGLAYPTQCQQALLHRSKSSLKTYPTRRGATVLHQHPWTFQKWRRGAIQPPSAHSSSQLHATSICRSHHILFPRSTAPSIYRSLDLPLPLSTTPSTFETIHLPLPPTSKPRIYHSLRLRNHPSTTPFGFEIIHPPLPPLSKQKCPAEIWMRFFQHTSNSLPLMT